MNLNMLISLADVVASLAFTLLVLRQYLTRKKMHQLLWGIALALWTIAVVAELWASVSGWSPLAYRAYYAAGALLIPAWLGMGTLYLIVAKHRAEMIFKTLAAASLLGIALIAFWPIDANALTSTPAQFVPLRVFPFFPIQLLLILLNIFGTIAFVGGALWSAFQFVRQRTQGQRARATVLIALGGAIAATAHSLGVLSGVELFRVSELIAVLFIFAGFLLSPPVTESAAS